MASPSKLDESNLTTTKDAAPAMEAAPIATNTKTLATTAANDTEIGANGITSDTDMKDEKIELQSSDTPSIETGNGDNTAGGDEQLSTPPPGDGAGQCDGDGAGDGPAITTPGSTAVTTPGTTSTIMSTASSNANSPQTPTSAPRTKPLEKPKPLKLPENTHQHHFHHTTQSQVLYHPGAAAGFTTLGGPSVIGGIPHSIFVGGTHLSQGGGGSLANHVHQLGQQQQNALNQAAIGPSGDGMAAVSTDEILETMEQINRSVKASQFSTTLAGYIFRLYGYLKHVGEFLEQSHKPEMNRVFVSLRQACCRDSGQLGTPCRLKIMELVELRAMGWRPNLSHSQYYLNRGAGSLTNGFNNASSTIAEFNPIAPTEAMSGGDMEQLGAAPVSAPPFGTFPMNPFPFNIPPTSLAAGPVVSAADLVSTAAAAAAASISPPQAPSYYLIPASHVGHTQAGIAFLSPTAAATVLPPPPISPLAATTAAAAVAAAAAAAHQHQHQQQRLHLPVSATLSQPAMGGTGVNPSTSPTLQAGGSSISGIFPKGAVTKTSGKYSRPAKIPGKSQYRDEVIIRNADSGKSKKRYYKVPQGAKERSLTITGPSEEAIEQAKGLIEETIRRNVSPARGEEDGDGVDIYRRASVIATRFEDDGDTQSNEGNGDEVSEDGEDGKEQGTEGGGEMTFEAGQLGEMLKLQCSDPALLEAAKQALSAYFRGQKQPHGHQALRRTTTDGASRDQSRKERRKSMPVIENQRALALKQASPPNINAVSQEAGLEEDPKAAGEQDVAGAAEGGKSGKPLTLTMMISPPIGKQRASSNARSTPNLAATGLNKRALCMMKSMDMSENARGTVEGAAAVETKFMADESGGGTLVINEKKSRVTVRVVYTREFVLQCATSPFANLSPTGLPWMTRETPDILRPVPGKFDVTEYKQTCLELRQLYQ